LQNRRSKRPLTALILKWLWNLHPFWICRWLSISFFGKYP
jgi:hypothetical protein